MYLTQEHLQQIEAILLETPFKYANPLLVLLSNIAKEQAPKEEPKEEA